MTEEAEKFMAQLRPEDAAALRIRMEKEEREPNQELARFNRLLKKVDDGIATPEELAEYDEEMRPHKEMREQYGHGKYYDDRG